MSSQHTELSKLPARVQRQDSMTHHRNVQQFRDGLVFKAHRLLYHSTLGLRVIKKKKKSVHIIPTWQVELCQCTSFPLGKYRHGFRVFTTHGAVQTTSKGSTPGDRLRVGWGLTRREHSLFWDRPRVVYHRVYFSVRRIASPTPLPREEETT